MESRSCFAVWGTPAAANRPNRNKIHLILGQLRVGEGEKRHRPNAQHYPSGNESPLKVGDSHVAEALARREQPPEPEQTTSDNW